MNTFTVTNSIVTVSCWDCPSSEKVCLCLFAYKGCTADPRLFHWSCRPPVRGRGSGPSEKTGLFQISEPWSAVGILGSRGGLSSSSRRCRRTAEALPPWMPPRPLREVIDLCLGLSGPVSCVRTSCAWIHCPEGRELHQPRLRPS